MNSARLLEPDTMRAPLTQRTRRCHLPPLAIVGPLFVLLVMLGIGQTYIVNVIGVAYPAFMSFLALESDGLDDDKMWLTYWVCFGCFNIIE